MECSKSRSPTTILISLAAAVPTELVIHLSAAESMSWTEMDSDEKQVALLYGRIIVACLAILVAVWQLDVEVPVIA